MMKLPAFAALAFLVAGCGSAADKDSAKSDGKTVSPALDERAPKGYPTDVPLYPSFSGWSKKSDGAETAFVFTTTDPPDKVLAFYQTKLKENGWDLGESLKTGDSIAFTAAKEDRLCTVDAAPARIIITISRK